MLHINVLGLATIAQDVTPELARATIASVSVLGALHAAPRSRPLSPTERGDAMLNQQIVRDATRLTRAGRLGACLVAGARPNLSARRPQSPQRG
jgi:hypothetical protein